MLSRRQSGRAHQRLGCACDLDEVDSVDDPGPASGDPAVDRVRVAEVGTRARGFLEVPRAEVTGGVGRVARVSRQLPGRGQGRDLNAQRHERPAVINEILRVGEAVALNVRTVGMLGVRPPIVSLGEEVVDSAGASRGSGGGHRLRQLGEIRVGGVPDPLALEGREIEGSFSRSGAGQREYNNRMEEERDQEDLSNQRSLWGWARGASGPDSFRCWNASALSANVPQPRACLGQRPERNPSSAVPTPRSCIYHMEISSRAAPDSKPLVQTRYHPSSRRGVSAIPTPDVRTPQQSLRAGTPRGGGVAAL